MLKKSKLRNNVTRASRLHYSVSPGRNYCLTSRQTNHFWWSVHSDFLDSARVLSNDSWCSFSLLWTKPANCRKGYALFFAPRKEREELALRKIGQRKCLRESSRRHSFFMLIDIYTRAGITDDRIDQCDSVRIGRKQQQDALACSYRNI